MFCCVYRPGVRGRSRPGRELSRTEALPHSFSTRCIKACIRASRRGTVACRICHAPKWECTTHPCATVNGRFSSADIPTSCRCSPTLFSSFRASPFHALAIFAVRRLWTLRCGIPQNNSKQGCKHRPACLKPCHTL
jgi:hypothetical protein